MTELPQWAQTTIEASNVRCIENTELPQELCLRRFASEVGWSYLRNTNEKWKSVHASTIGKLTPSLTDALVETTSQDAVLPDEAPEDWHVAFSEALDTFGRVRCHAEVEPYAQRYLHHHAFVAERRADSSSKGHREATPQELSGMAPDPTRVGVVIVGEDNPREFRGNPLQFLKDIAQRNKDSTLQQQYLDAKRGQPIRSAPFIRALNVPCIVMEDRLPNHYQAFINHVISYHDSTKDE
jgi:hypothetical protein